MIVDANVLLYAVDGSAANHPTARAFLERHLNGNVRVGLPWHSLSAFLRISTHPRIMTTPLTGEAAAGFVDDWLAAPLSWLPDVTATTWVIMRDLVKTHGVTANLVPDTQLAALAIQYGVPVVSADTDFARFREVAWENPFAA